MSAAVEQRREVETLAWITDDEAEFWTSSSPRTQRGKAFDQFPILKKEDSLSSVFKNKIEKEAQVIAENAGKKQIFEFDNTVELNENIPGVNMSFLERLLHQLTRPRQPQVEYYSDEDFTEIDESEVTAVINPNIQQTWDYENPPKVQNTFIITIRSFIEELNEETDVILGTIDEETLVNRRSHRAKS